MSAIAFKLGGLRKTVAQKVQNRVVAGMFQLESSSGGSISGQLCVQRTELKKGKIVDTLPES